MHLKARWCLFNHFITYTQRITSLKNRLISDAELKSRAASTTTTSTTTASTTTASSLATASTSTTSCTPIHSAASKVAAGSTSATSSKGHDIKVKKCFARIAFPGDTSFKPSGCSSAASTSSATSSGFKRNGADRGRRFKKKVCVCVGRGLE